MKKYDILASGYVSMDRIVKLKSPMQVGFTSLIQNKSSNDIQYGGCSVNICYDLCKIGVKAMPIMRVGEDYKEIGFESFLKNANIPLDAIEIINNEKTSFSYLLQDNQGQHVTLFYAGAMDEKFAKPLDDELFKNTKLAIMTVASIKDNQNFFEMCKKHNIPLIFSMKGDVNAFPKEFLHDVLLYSKMIFTNEVERESIENTFNFNMDELLSKGNCDFLITTLGENGSICYYKEYNQIKTIKVPVYNNCKLVDTTGCGDGFVSGFLYGYMKNMSAKDCTIFATALSSYIIEKEGCCTNAPNESMLVKRYDEIKNLLNGDV